MRRIALLAITAVTTTVIVACGGTSEPKRADVSFEFQQTEAVSSSGNLAQIITTETRCIAISSDRDPNAKFAAGFSGAKANGTINVPEGTNKFTLSSYSGQVDANDTTKCTGNLHEQFNVNADIVAGEANTLVLHPLRASWNVGGGTSVFDPHSLVSTHATIKPFDVKFSVLDFEQDVDPHSGKPVLNSYDVHIKYDTNTLTMPARNTLLPQFSASTSKTSTAYDSFFSQILFDTEQYSGLYSLCSPYPGLTGSADSTGCNLRVKAVPDVKRDPATKDLSDGGLTLVSNLGVYAVENGIALLSIGFDPCSYITHESPLVQSSCSYTIQDSNNNDITATVRDKFKSTVASGVNGDVMSLHFVELKVHNPTSQSFSSFELSANEYGAPSPTLGASTGNYSFEDPYKAFAATTSGIQASTATGIKCYTDSNLVITTVTSNPLSPNYGQSGYNPQIAKSTKLTVDICGHEAPILFSPSPSRVTITQSEVEKRSIDVDTTDSAKGVFKYTKATQVGAGGLREKGTFFNLVVTDYYDASQNSLNDAAAKIGTAGAPGSLSFFGRPENTIGNPLGRLSSESITSYAYDINNSKTVIPASSAVRFWLYDYLDLYTVDVSEAGVVKQP